MMTRGRSARAASRTFSGKNYKAVAYEVDRETMRIEPEKFRRMPWVR